MLCLHEQIVKRTDNWDTMTGSHFVVWYTCSDGSVRLGVNLPPPLIC